MAATCQMDFESNFFDAKAARNQLVILRTIGSQYDSDSKRKVDAALQSLFDLIGLHVSLSGQLMN